MKTNNLTKIIIVIVIILSISLTIRAAKSVYINKSIDLSNNPPITEDESENNVDKNPAKNTIDGEINNNLPDQPIIESPDAVDLIIDESPIVENPTIIEELPIDIPVIREEPSSNKPIVEENNKDDSEDDKPNNNSSKKPNNQNNSKNNKSNNKKGNDKKDNNSIISSKVISKDQAIEIGLKKLGSNSKLIEIVSKLDENPQKYVLKIANNKFKYKIEIHAKTGAILDYKKE